MPISHNTLANIIDYHLVYKLSSYLIFANPMGENGTSLFIHIPSITGEVEIFLQER